MGEERKVITTTVRVNVDARFLSRRIGVWTLVYAYSINDTLSFLGCDDGGICKYDHPYYHLRTVTEPDGKEYDALAVDFPWVDLFMRMVSVGYMARWEEQEFPCIDRDRVRSVRSREWQLVLLAKRKAEGNDVR